MASAEKQKPWNLVHIKCFKNRKKIRLTNRKQNASFQILGKDRERDDHQSMKTLET